MITAERVATAHAPHEAVVDSVGSGLVVAVSVSAAAAGKVVVGCTQAADTHAEV